MLTVMAFAPTTVLADGFEGKDYSELGKISVTDTRYEWGQDEKKEWSALIDDDVLVLKSKKEDKVVWSTVELPVNVQDDEYVYGVIFNEPKPEEDKSFGLILNFSNEENYKAIYIYKKGYEYVSVENGKPLKVKSGLLKFNKKSKATTVLVHYAGQKLSLIVNGMEMTTINRIEYEYPVFGAFISGKNEAEIPSFIFKVAEGGDIEQSSTPN